MTGSAYRRLYLEAAHQANLVLRDVRAALAVADLASRHPGSLALVILGDRDTIEELASIAAAIGKTLPLLPPAVAHSIAEEALEALRRQRQLGARDGQAGR